jgi:hypothetical protein
MRFPIISEVFFHLTSHNLHVAHVTRHTSRVTRHTSLARQVKSSKSLHYMWCLGVANACEVSIPSLGLDDKHLTAAAASADAFDSKNGLSSKKLGREGRGLKGAVMKMMKGGAGPFSTVQLKEIGASLAKNCCRWRCVG